MDHVQKGAGILFGIKGEISANFGDGASCFAAVAIFVKDGGVNDGDSALSFRLKIGLMLLVTCSSN